MAVAASVPASLSRGLGRLSLAPMKDFLDSAATTGRSRQRSLLALIGIVIGIGSVIGMVSIGTIVQQEAVRQFKDMGVDIVTIRKSFSENKKIEFSLDIIMRITEEKRNILDVAPYLTSGSELTQGRQKIGMEKMGVTASFFDRFKQADHLLLSGRNIDIIIF